MSEEEKPTETAEGEKEVVPKEEESTATFEPVVSFLQPSLIFASSWVVQRN